MLVLEYMSGTHEKLAQRIADERRRVGLSQETLADKAGISYSTLTKIERGAILEPSVFTVAKLAGAIGISLDKLLSIHLGKDEKSHPATDIQFVYFDVHGVIVTNWQQIFTEVAARFHIEPQSMELGFWKYNDIVNRGHMTVDEFEVALARSIDLHMNKLPYEKIYFETVKGDKVVHKLMQDVAEHYRLGLMTNIFPGFLDRLIDTGAVPNLDYEAVIESCEIGAMKPESPIYEYAAAQAGVNPEHILLVDDIKANLDAAGHLGWQTFWYDEQHPDRSIADLRTLLLG